MDMGQGGWVWVRLPLRFVKISFLPLQLKKVRKEKRR